MINHVSIDIKNIKNIKEAFLEMPLQKGTSVIVGGNGSGKSTILQALSQSFTRNSLQKLYADDYSSDSKVVIRLSDDISTWTPVAGKGWQSNDKKLKVNGLYEGSLFYGSRFHDSRLVDAQLRSGGLRLQDIVDADDYIKDKLSYILHGTRDMYPGLKRLKNRAIGKELGFKNTPYFNKIDGKVISQYRMSSGECLLITLLHFVYNSVIRRSLSPNEYILALIDEIEVALHPIAVHRFLETINELVTSYENLMVIITSHSPEVIRKIKPNNIYKLENDNGFITAINPAYPSYVIRDVYKHDGFDTLILVEDILAKILVQKIIEDNNLSESRLVHVVPAGGWENVLRLHRDLLNGNVLGLERKIFSVIDGDVQSKIPDTYKSQKKIFLPIESIEKFLLEICEKPSHSAIKKKIGDKYFLMKSLPELYAEHTRRYNKGVSSESKKFYFRLSKDLSDRGIAEEVFIEKLASDLLSTLDFSKFTESLSELLK